MTVSRPYALSLHRPWTSLVMHGLKLVENRTWQPPQDLIAGSGPDPFPVWLVIHGAQPWDDAALDAAAAALPKATVKQVGADWSDPDGVPTGYLGIVQVIGFCLYGTREETAELCRCGPFAVAGQVHWRLARPMRFPKPIPGPGRQRLWLVPEKVQKAVDELLDWPQGLP